MNQKYEKLYLLELDNVSDKKVMKASDLCQNSNVMVGDTNYGFYYTFTASDVKSLLKLGAEIEEFENVEIVEFLNKTDFLEYCNTHDYIDTETRLKSGIPAKYYYNVLIYGDKNYKRVIGEPIENHNKLCKAMLGLDAKLGDGYFSLIEKVED